MSQSKAEGRGGGAVMKAALAEAGTKGPMADMTDMPARREWRAAWPLPVIAMLGVAGAAGFAYSSGVFLGPMTREFHWTRAGFSSGFTFQMLAALVMLPLAGRLVDRFGAKAVAFPGIFIAMVGALLLGFANNGSLVLWLGLCALQSSLAALVSPPVWMSVVVQRFDRSRGLALATALSGIGVAMTVWPPLTATVLQHFGWRAGFATLALYWPVVMFPLALIFFRVASRSAAQPVKAPAPSLTPSQPLTLRSRTFVFISLSGGLFALVAFGLTVHIVPILRANGFSLQAAANLAGLTGVCSIIGRVGTGFLLDRISTRLLGLVVFLLPLPIMALLWERSAAAATLAVALLGLAGGAETDVITFLAAKRFGRTSFASVYANVTAVFGICSSAGPILAGAAFDRYGSYAPFFLLAVPIILLAAALVWFVPGAPADGERVR